MVDFDPRKALFEYRIDDFGVDLRERAITIERAAFFQRLFVKLFDRFGLCRNRLAK